ncbi:MAG: membrane dipeptidase [Myxococcaceae bacterium]
MPISGFADLHTHPMAHLGFGGRLLAGEPDGPIERALARCDVGKHGSFGLGNFGPGWTLVQAMIEGGFGHGPCGHDSYASWPHFGTIAHQQMYVDWLRRAYDGGLRLLCGHAVNNELLAREFGAQDAFDRKSIELQVRELRAFVSRHSDWMDFAATPSEARAIAASDKLVVVAGVEVDSLDGVAGDPRALDDPQQIPGAVSAILEWLRELGVSMMTPIHLADNRFGGCAVYSDRFNLLNHHLRGRYYFVGGNPSVAFRLGEDSELATKAAIAYYELTRHSPYPSTGYRLNAPGQGHANNLGLTRAGEALVREAIRQGFILDVDHMSERCTDAVLDVAEQLSYPVVSSHSSFREQGLGRDETSRMDKRSHEGMKTRRQAERIIALGGIVAPITNQCELQPFVGGTVENDCARSSKTWAQSYQYALSLIQQYGKGGVAFGTDFNGLAQQPGPRYGPNAAAGLIGDHLREKRRPVQIKQQGPRLDYAGTMYRSSAPFTKSVAGRREFDLNDDGLAHYGMLPDFIQDLRHVGMTDAQLDPLFRSAESFVALWEKCTERGAAIVAGEPPSFGNVG